MTSSGGYAATGPATNAQANAQLPKAPPLSAAEKELAEQALREFFTIVFAKDNAADTAERAQRNGSGRDEFVRSLNALSSEEISGKESCKDAVRSILSQEFAFDERDWQRLVYTDEDTERVFGLGVKIDQDQTRDPFVNVFQTRIGRGVYEAQELTDEEVLKEIRGLVVDWHDLFADAFPFIGKLFVKLKHSETGANLEETVEWVENQWTTKLVYNEEKNDYVEGGEDSVVSLRFMVRQLLLTMYVYEKMSLRSLLDPNFLAALHRYYEGALAEAQKGLSGSKRRERAALLVKGTFGSMFMQLKQASVSVTFPGLSALKHGEAVKPEVAAGLLGILSVNIFEAVMGELIVKGRLGNGVCGVALIGTESQKDIRYVTDPSKVPQLKTGTNFHKAVLFGQGVCPADLVGTPVYPTHIPLDPEYLNAYTSWNALFTTTMSDNHVVFAKLLYPRMLRAMIHDPGQWGDQRPWTLYMAVSGFWLRTEKRMDFLTSADFFAAQPKEIMKVLQNNAAHLKHKVADKIGSMLPGLRQTSPESEESDTPDISSDLFHELHDLLPRSALHVNDDEEDSADDDEGACDQINVSSMLTHVTDHREASSSGHDRNTSGTMGEKVRELTENFAGRRVDRWTRNRWVAGLYKPTLPEYPEIIQYWTEMNHRYGDLLMQNVDEYNFDRRFQQKYELVSLKARKGELIDPKIPHDPLPKDDHRTSPLPAVPTYSTKFVAKEITKTGGRTHDYLDEFYGTRNEEMAEMMHSAIYPGAQKMDMKAIIAQTRAWKERYGLP